MWVKNDVILNLITLIQVVKRFALLVMSSSSHMIANMMATKGLHGR